MFWQKLLAWFGVQVIQVDARERRLQQGDWDQLERELEQMRARCLEAARAKYVSDRVRAEEVVVDESRPDEEKAEDLRVTYEHSRTSLKERLLAMLGLQLIEVHVYVAECRVQRRIAHRGLGGTWREAYGSLFGQLTEGKMQLDTAEARASKPVVREVSIELSDAGAPAEIDRTP
jgi:hypothetical protein